jgi:hypothetical protein
MCPSNTLELTQNAHFSGLKLMPLFLY